jgi:hypothetical protein
MSAAGVTNMTDDDILKKAHRMCWRYKFSSDPHHSDTYTFEKFTMIDFARAIAKEAYLAGSNDCHAAMKNTQPARQ